MLIQQGRNFLTHGYELLSLRLTWFGVEPIFQCPHVVVHGASLLCSDTPYHTLPGIATGKGENYQFRHIFFTCADCPSLCRQWCNSQSLIATSHNGIFNADGFGPASSFLVYCGADFAWRASFCTALFLPLRGGGPGQRPGECGRRIAGRDACPPNRAFLSAVTLPFLGRKPLSATIAHKGANTAFHSLGGDGCHLPCRRATQALTKADTWFCVFGLRSSIQIGGHWWRISR